jgi:hypothetical protein
MVVAPIDRTTTYAIEACDSEQVIVARTMADLRYHLTRRRDLLIVPHGLEFRRDRGLASTLASGVIATLFVLRSGRGSGKAAATA